MVTRIGTVDFGTKPKFAHEKLMPGFVPFCTADLLSYRDITKVINFLLECREWLDCANQGTCNDDGTCTCFDGYSGPDCSGKY